MNTFLIFRQLHYAMGSALRNARKIQSANSRRWTLSRVFTCLTTHELYRLYNVESSNDHLGPPQAEAHCDSLNSAQFLLEELR